MSRFMEEFAAFLAASPFEIIRVSQAYGGEIETMERVPASFCQNVYSVAKTFTMTALGLLYDRGLLGLHERLCDILADELPEIVDLYTRKMEAFIAKRESETGRTNPMYTNLNWHANPNHEGPYETSQQAYDGLYIGGIADAVKLQQKK